jgi:hypothetical protein
MVEATRVPDIFWTPPRKVILPLLIGTGVLTVVVFVSLEPYNGWVPTIAFIAGSEIGFGLLGAFFFGAIEARDLRSGISTLVEACGPPLERSQTDIRARCRRSTAGRVSNAGFEVEMDCFADETPGTCSLVPPERATLASARRIAEILGDRLGHAEG